MSKLVLPLLVCAVLTFRLLNGYAVESSMGEVTTPEQDTKVMLPMALAEIPAGMVVTEEMLGQAPALREKLDRDICKTNRVIVGRVVKDTIAAAQPISTQSLYLPEGEQVLPFGQRVRVVDGTGWVVEGELKKVVDGWVRVVNDSGREVFVSAGPSTMFEVIGDNTESFVSTSAESSTP